MKIQFVCSSLAAGLDGVGDYVRALAAGCTAMGVECRILALNDQHLSSSEIVVESDGQVVRYPTSQPWNLRVKDAQQKIHDYQPDWVSFQLVLYGFNRKGIADRRLFKLGDLREGTFCHVMLHELWIGLPTADGLRARIVGALQKRSLLQLVERLQPDLIETSNSTYQGILSQFGVESSVSPLFSNIPVVNVTSDTTRATFQKYYPATITSPRSELLIGLTFGTHHAQWNPEATALYFKAVAKEMGRYPLLIACGHIGTHGPRLLERFTAASGIPVAITGDVSADEVSRLLQTVDFGIALHPWALIGKSGAAAAMAEHGLPVLVPRDDWVCRITLSERVSSLPFFTRMADVRVDEFSAWLTMRRRPQGRLEEVASGLVGRLSSFVDLSTARNRALQSPN